MRQTAKATTGAAAVVLCIVVAGGLAAQGNADAGAAAIVPKADENGDGFYSYPELRALHPTVAEEEFSAIDTSGDGLIDAQELRQAYRSGQLSPQDG